MSKNKHFKGFFLMYIVFFFRKIKIFKKREKMRYVLDRF